MIQHCKEKKQWNGTDNANSSYNRPKKRKNKNENSYKYCSEAKQNEYPFNAERSDSE